MNLIHNSKSAAVSDKRNYVERSFKVCDRLGAVSRVGATHPHLGVFPFVCGSSRGVWEEGTLERVSFRVAICLQSPVL